MEIGEYQIQAQLTDQLLAEDRVVPLLGMAGEVGSLLTEYKKWLRDGDAYQLFPEQIAEELGDILWYLANAATKFGLGLDAIASANLAKTQDRWLPRMEEFAFQLFDEDCVADEQLPRRFTVKVGEEQDSDAKISVQLRIDDKPAGSLLRDNSHEEDGYRFHDIFHLAYAAKLGWSPVLRGVLLSPGRKRRSDSKVDEVEDGGRAIVIEEAIVAYVWEYARRRKFLEGLNTVDYEVLRTVKLLTSGLEVRARSLHQWEEAILAGYTIWRLVNSRKQGLISVDLIARNIELLC